MELERPRGWQAGTGRAPVALLVDDYEDTREMYSEILRLGGYGVIEAVDGADGVTLALAQHVDIIVMDLCMPRMDGREAVRRLKADPRTAHIPVVVLTALEWTSRAGTLNCAAYLIKPCLPLELLNVLNVLLPRFTQ